MFQSFKVISNRDAAKSRVAQLRVKLEEQGLDGFLVPRADEHQGEYVPECAQRLGWLTGFTGSAGMAVILARQAFIFVDGRYTLQVRQQTDGNLFDYHDLVPEGLGKWLAQYGGGLKIGFDPWLHTIAECDQLREIMAKVGGQLVAVSQNLVDLIWSDQPAAPQAPVSIQPLEFAGQAAAEKLQKMDEQLIAVQAQACVLTDPSSIAWVFNIRGRDVSNAPLPLAFAILRARKRPLLFIDECKLGRQEREYLENLCQIASPDMLETTLSKMTTEGEKFLLDERLSAEKIRLIIEAAGGRHLAGKDPARLPRAVKNTAELAGARAAHLRDGVALVKFFAWFDRQAPGTQDEISLAIKLEQCRFETANDFGMRLEDLSFDSISGAGPDGAIIHYRVSEETNKILQAGELYLIDSGAQYRDGTTDVTRTVVCQVVGQAAGREEKRCFTLVLKGMIAISMARFPQNTRGVDLDCLARNALWQAGFDYAHGTGHGVGSYLSVHEGPQSLSRYGMEPFLPGMIVSNEPGYYRNGQFGIRIENLLIVKPAEEIAGGELAMLGFESLTLCPIDRRLITVDMLTQVEKTWLDDYHTLVLNRLSPYLDEQDRAWLQQACAVMG